MSTLRNRLVIHQVGADEHVSSVLLKPSEVVPMIDTEEAMHKAAGWRVTRYGHVLRCQHNATVRWVWVRSRTPQEDKL